MDPSDFNFVILYFKNPLINLLKKSRCLNPTLPTAYLSESADITHLLEYGETITSSSAPPYVRNANIKYNPMKTSSGEKQTQIPRAVV